MKKIVVLTVLAIGTASAGEWRIAYWDLRESPELQGDSAVGLTHLVIDGAATSSRDSLDFTLEESVASKSVAAVHAAGAQVLLGINELRDAEPKPGDATRTAELGTNIARIVDRFGFDGVSLRLNSLGSESRTSLERWFQELRRQMGTRTIIVFADVRDVEMWADVAEFVDVVNVEATSNSLDLRYASHRAPLYSGSPDTPSVDAAVQRFIAAGLPASKLAVVIPLYGLLWTTDAQTVEPQKLFYPQVLSYVRDSAPRWDYAAASPYVTSSDSGNPFVLAFEDPRSVAVKARYVKDRGLGGWSIDGLAGDSLPGRVPSRPLTEAVLKAATSADAAASISASPIGELRTPGRNTSALPLISLRSLPEATNGLAYHQTLVASGSYPIVWMVSSGTVPPGMSLGTLGMLSGIPTTDGFYSFSISATNSAGSNSRSFSLAVKAAVAPLVTSGSGLPSATVGLSYTQVLTASGTAPISWSLISGTLPNGLTLSKTGTLTGKPSAAGNYSFLVQATNSVGTNTKQLRVAVGQPAVQQPSVLTFLAQPADGLVGVALAPSVKVAAVDASGKVLSSASNIVTLALSSGGSLAGTTSVAAQNGVATFTNLSATGAGGGFTLTATSPGFSAATSNRFSISALVNASPNAAVSADDFVNSVGLNVHFSYLGSVYTTQTALMMSDINQLHIRHLRDQMVAPGTSWANLEFQVHNQLGFTGIKTDYGIADINFPISQVAVYPTLVNDIEAVEAANEYDASGDPNWAAKIKAQQAALYAEVRGSSTTSGITVIAPSLAQPEFATALGDLSTIADVGDSHAYFQGWNPGNPAVNNVSYFMTKARVNVSGKPVWATETGFWSQQAKYWGGSGVGESLMASYETRALLEFWLAGAQRTYLYELADFSPAVFFGLVRADGSPKPAFSAISNLLGLLTDPGAPFTAGALAYNLQGGTSQVHRLLLQKRDGSFYLALWLEVPGMDPASMQNINVPPQSVQVTLGRFPSALTVYALESTGSMSSSSITASQNIPISIGPNVTILKIN